MSAAGRLRSALSDFTNRPPFFGCRHVVQHGAGPVLCVQHPRAGLLCARCADTHIRRHDPAEESTCDQCRCEADLLRPMVGATKLTGGPVRDTRGYHRMLSAEVLLVGAGTCGSCFEDTGRTVVDLDAAVWGSGWRA